MGGGCGILREREISYTTVPNRSDLETVNLAFRFWEAGLKCLRSYASSISYLKLSFVYVVLVPPMCKSGFAVI